MSLVNTSAGTAGTVTGPDNASPLRDSQVATSTGGNSAQSTVQPTVQPAVVTTAVDLPASSPSPNLTNAQASSTSLPPSPSPVVQSANPNPPKITSSSRNNSPVTNRPVPSSITSTTSSASPSGSSAPPQDLAPFIVITTTSGSTVVTITTTPAQHASAIQTSTAAPKPQSFLENRPAMVGVFSSVGALLLLAVVGFCVLAVRRRGRKRLEMEAIDFTPSAVHLLAAADTGKDEEKGSVGGRTRQSDTSFYSQGSVGAGGALASSPPSEMQMVPQQPVMSNFAGMGSGAGYHDDREGFARPYYDPMRQQQQRQQQQQEWSLPDLPPVARHPPQLRPAYDASRVVPTGYRRPTDAPTQTSSLPPFAASGVRCPGVHHQERLTLVESVSTRSRSSRSLLPLLFLLPREVHRW
ncbi:hypothetical protein BGW80DRAFT_282952 [Lactifluus volemus]|nr:hypothetical protein BGW80DRAFT_282952 [Lactifluus volemus]